MHGRHEPVVTRGDEIAIGLGGARLGLAALGGALEGRADIGHLLHPSADGREIGTRLDAARRRKIERTGLVPIDAVGTNDIVERPTLFGKALSHGLILRAGECRSACWRKARANTGGSEGAKNTPAVHNCSSLIWRSVAFEGECQNRSR